MPTMFTHPVVPLAIGLGLGSGVISRRLLAAGVGFSILPDVDVYTEPFIPFIVHRGITHTLFFAFICGGLGALFARALHASRLTAFLFVTVVTASHGLLDACTTGGGAIFFFWPISMERYFLPFQVIEVSPLGLMAFLSERGLHVFVSELKWVWPPAIALGIGLYLARKAAARNVT